MNNKRSNIYSFKLSLRYVFRGKKFNQKYMKKMLLERDLKINTCIELWGKVKKHEKQKLVVGMKSSFKFM